MTLQLADADGGIAIGTGTEVALQIAGLTLSTTSSGCPWQPACLYPTFGLLLSPVIAAAAMSLSSVSVIGNALRLQAARIYGCDRPFPQMTRKSTKADQTSSSDLARTAERVRETRPLPFIIASVDSEDIAVQEDRPYKSDYGSHFMGARQGGNLWIVSPYRWMKV